MDIVCVEIYSTPVAAQSSPRQKGQAQAITNEANIFVLKDIMGHASLQTTLKYTHLNAGDLKKQHTKFSPLNNLFRK